MKIRIGNNTWLSAVAGGLLFEGGESLQIVGKNGFLLDLWSPQKRQEVRLEPGFYSIKHNLGDCLSSGTLVEVLPAT